MKNAPDGKLNEKELPQISKIDLVRATLAADPASSNAETPAASSSAPSADADQKLSCFVETRFDFCYRAKIRLDSQTLQIGRKSWSPPTSRGTRFTTSSNI